MANFPRRSPRFTQHLSDDQIRSGQSSYSSTSSLSSTAQPSPVNNLTAPNPLNNLNQTQSRFSPSLLNQSLPFGAPLPSPSASENAAFFSRVSPQQIFYMGQSGQQNQSSSHSSSSQSQHLAHGGQQYGQQQSQSQSQPQQQQSAVHHHNSFSKSSSQPQRPNLVSLSSSDQSPHGLPPNFLAEAAKRAQMACLMRDLGDVAI